MIVDMMYGQLKSTVTCLSCNNVSITFDPFLTLSLPIPKRLKLTVAYIPYDVFREGKRKPNIVMQVPLEPESTVKDLVEKVREVIHGKSKADKQSLVCNYQTRSGLII